MRALWLLDVADPRDEYHKVCESDKPATTVWTYQSATATVLATVPLDETATIELDDSLVDARVYGAPHVVVG
jgi:hypothetical protein